MSAVDAVPATRSSSASAETDASGLSPVRHRSIEVGDVRLFYREAGAPDAPAVLLLHGFAASSYMFRELIPQLARDYHVIAPDLPGFGQTSVAPGARFDVGVFNLADRKYWNAGALPLVSGSSATIDRYSAAGRNFAVNFSVAW